MEQDEDLYLKAHKELNSKSKKEAVWIKALTLCKGDTEAAKYEYINLRVNEFKNVKLFKQSPLENKNNEIRFNIISDTSDLNNDLNKKTIEKLDIEPEIFRYIQAWLIAAVSSTLLNTLLTAYLQKNFATQDALAAFYVYSPFLSGTISFGIWVAVVNIDYYKNLNISKLVFWIFLLGGLGTIGSLYRTQMLFELSGNSVPNNFSFYSIIAFIIWVGAFYVYGEKEKRTSHSIFFFDDA